MLRDCLLCIFLLSLMPSSVLADDPAELPRLTSLVKVIQNIQPAVVALFTPLNNQIFSGSGTIIHEDGYLLTNNHALPADEGCALLPKSGPIRFRVVGRVPESDIAIIRLITIHAPVRRGEFDGKQSGHVELSRIHAIAAADRAFVDISHQTFRLLLVSL